MKHSLVAFFTQILGQGTDGMNPRELAHAASLAYRGHDIDLSAISVSRTSQVMHGRVNASAFLLGLLHIETSPGNAVLADPRDHHPAHIERRSIAAMSSPDPFRPGNLPFGHDTQEFGLQIRHTGKECGPIGADLLITIERPV